MDGCKNVIKSEKSGQRNDISTICAVNNVWVPQNELVSYSETGFGFLQQQQK